MNVPARSTNLVVILGTVLLLGAYSGRPQMALAPHHKGSAPAYKGVEGDPFVAKNWTPGDRTSQENQIHARGRYQNEYNKTS